MDDSAPTRTDQVTIVAISTRSAETLERTRLSLAARLDRAGGDLRDIATTLAAREPFPHRAAWLVDDRVTAAHALRTTVPLNSGRDATGTPTVGVVFGASPRLRSAAALRLHAAAPAAAAVIDQIAAMCGHADVGAFLAAIDDPESKVRLAANAAVQMGFYAHLRELGLDDGHPIIARDELGESVCAVLRGDLDPATALTNLPEVETAAGPEPTGYDLLVGVAAGGAGDAVVLCGDDLGDAALARTVAVLWCHGLDMDVTLCRPGRRIHLTGIALERTRGPASPPAGAGASRPLTPWEQRLLFQDMVRTSSSAEHNVIVAGWTPASVDAAALNTCLADAARAHDERRLVYSRIGDRWLACVRDDLTVTFEATPGQSHDDAYARALAEDFPLVDEFLLRAVVSTGTGTGTGTGTDADADRGTVLALVSHQAFLIQPALDAFLADVCRGYRDVTGSPLDIAPFTPGAPIPSRAALRPTGGS